MIDKFKDKLSSKKYGKSIKMVDKFITRSKLVLPIFVLLLFLIFEFTFTFWNMIADFLDNFLNYLYWLMWINNVFLDSIFGGLLWLVVFSPNIIILYFFLFLLDESYILPRISYVFDRYLKRVWLSWNWFLSLFMWFWCTIPAILSTKSIENKKERILTVMMLPFISCSAKLPVFVLFVSIFIPKSFQSIVLILIYLFWIILWIISTLILSKIIKNKRQELTINLPNYNIPNIWTVFKKVIFMLKDFFIKIWIYIIPISIILTLAFSYPNSNDIKNTYWWKFGSYIQTIFEPIGFNEEMSISVVSWFMAKEITVSTLGSIYYIKDSDTDWLINKIKADKSISIFSAISFIIFVLLYTPCVSAIVTARRELWNLWGTVFFVYPLIFAWLISFIFYQSAVLLFG